jgi:hypothetical protein
MKQKDKEHLEEAVKLLGMLETHLGSGDLLEDVGPNYAPHMHQIIFELVVDAGQASAGGVITRRQAENNVKHYLEHRGCYNAMNLGWICSKEFERYGRDGTN